MKLKAWAYFLSFTATALEGSLPQTIEEIDSSMVLMVVRIKVKSFKSDLVEHLADPAIKHCLQGHLYNFSIQYNKRSS